MEKSNWQLATKPRHTAAVTRISFPLELCIERESMLVIERLIILRTGTVIIHARTAHNASFTALFFEQEVQP